MWNAADRWQIVAAILCLVFALPSCFTSMLWRNGTRTDAGPWRCATGAAANDTPPRFCCQVAQLPEDTLSPERARLAKQFVELRERWRPPLAPGSWVQVEPQEHGDVVLRLWRQHPECCALQVLERPDDAAEPHCLFVCNWMSVPRVQRPPIEALPGIHWRNAGYFGSLVQVFEADCRLAPIDAPPGTASTPIRVHLGSHVGTLHRVLMTPLLFPLDVVLFPFELVGIGSWW